MEYLFSPWLPPCVLVLYVTPTLVAWWRAHHHVLAIGALNLLLGWTFMGWVAAFVWALTAVHRGAEGR
jgi:hypothetical protein